VVILLGNILIRVEICFRRHARALGAGLPRKDHIYMTTDELFRFRNDEFDEMPCKLDSSENPHSVKEPLIIGLLCGK